MKTVEEVKEWVERFRSVMEQDERGKETLEVVSTLLERIDTLEDHIEWLYFPDGREEEK